MKEKKDKHTIRASQVMRMLGEIQKKLQALIEVQIHQTQQLKVIREILEKHTEEFRFIKEEILAH